MICDKSTKKKSWSIRTKKCESSLGRGWNWRGMLMPPPSPLPIHLSILFHYGHRHKCVAKCPYDVFHQTKYRRDWYGRCLLELPLARSNDAVSASNVLATNMHTYNKTIFNPICIIQRGMLNYSHKIKDIKEVSRSNNSVPAKMARADCLTWMYLMAYKVHGLIRCISVSPGIEKNK